MGNELSELPENMSWFANLKTLNLSCNQFESNAKSSQLWSSIASIPNLQELDISRNMLRGNLA